MSDRYFFVFNSKNQAVYMESILKEKGYRVELRPTPSKLAKSCNTSLVVTGRPMEIEAVKKHISDCRMSVRGIYTETKTGYYTNYTKVY